MTDTYNKAFTEVLEILEYLLKEEYDKISKEKLEILKENQDIHYHKFDIKKSLNIKEISREANIILILLFKDCFATSIQKEKLENILINNEKKHQENLKEKYQIKELFKQKSLKDENKIDDIKELETKSLKTNKENIISKIIKIIKSMFRK